MEKKLPAIIILSLFSYALFAQCQTFFGDLVINEVMAGNDNTASDEFGEFDDWIEIYNGSGEILNLEGYFLSDNHGNRTKYIFPDVDLAPDDFLIIWCDNQPEQGPFHAAFGLNGTGEEVGLYNPDTISLDYVRYGPIPDDISIGRFPNGHGPFSVLIPTFESPNTNSVPVGVVINEYQPANESTASDQWGGFDDWIELYNNSDQPIDLTGYFLSDRIGEPTQFQFPDTVIEPGGYMIIWCDQGLFEPGLHAFFGLGGDGDDILLSDPDTLTVDYVRFGLVIPDETESRFPNGTGPFVCSLPTFESNNGDPSFINEVEYNTFVIYPNPSSGQIRFDLPSELLNETLEVYDITGKKVYQSILQSSSVELNLEFLTTGLYVVRVKNYRSKVLIE